MTPKKMYTFAIDPDLADALKRVKAADGVGESEQIRRALREWFERRGVLSRSKTVIGQHRHQAERKRASTRKRS